MLFALQVSFIVTLCLSSTCGNDVTERNTEHSNTRRKYDLEPIFSNCNKIHMNVQY